MLLPTRAERGRSCSVTDCGCLKATCGGHAEQKWLAACLIADKCLTGGCVEVDLRGGGGGERRRRREEEEEEEVACLALWTVI